MDSWNHPIHRSADTKCAPTSIRGRQWRWLCRCFYSGLEESLFQQLPRRARPKPPRRSGDLCIWNGGCDRSFLRRRSIGVSYSTEANNSLCRRVCTSVPGRGSLSRLTPPSRSGTRKAGVGLSLPACRCNRTLSPCGIAVPPLGRKTSKPYRWADTRWNRPSPHHFSDCRLYGQVNCPKAHTHD